MIPLTNDAEATSRSSRIPSSLSPAEILILRELEKLSWTDFRDLFQQVAREEGEDAALEILRLRCATDVELFAVLFFPHYCTREFNEFHRDFFGSVRFGERKVRRVRAAPRGSAKSTLATLIKPIHDVCYGLERFILFVSSTDDLAVAKLKDVRAEVLANFELQAVFGIHFPTRKPAQTEFLVCSDVSETYFRAVGKGGQIRGIRYKEWRPTKLLFDDFETSEEVANDRLRAKTEAIFHEEFGKTGDTDTNIEFVGTVLHKDALLPNLIRNPAYDGKTYRSIITWSEREDLWEEWRRIYTNLDNPARLADAQAFYEANAGELLRGTRVLWPDKKSYLEYMMDMVEIGKRAFMKEEQNEPMGARDPLFERIHWYREVEGGLLVESSGAIVPWGELRNSAMGALDPSTGAKKPAAGKLGDFSCQVTGFKDSKNRLFVHHDVTKRISPTKQIENIFDGHEKWKYSKFGAETNLFRELLMPNILEYQKRLAKEQKKHINIPFYDIVQTENKGERITRLEPKVNYGYILFNRALSQEFQNQVTDYPGPDHDDCPDAVEMLWNLATGAYRASLVAINAMTGH